jgi:hypothetical protein
MSLYNIIKKQDKHEQKGELTMPYKMRKILNTWKKEITGISL